MISALAMRGYIFFFNAGSGNSWITRCNANDTNSCKEYARFSSVRDLGRLMRALVHNVMHAFACVRVWLPAAKPCSSIMLGVLRFRPLVSTTPLPYHATPLATPPELQNTRIAPMVELPGQPFFFVPVNNQLFRCHVDGPVELWGQYRDDFYSLTVWGQDVWAGELRAGPTAVAMRCSFTWSRVFGRHSGCAAAGAYF